jgi:opacity protein-like surface antigen
MLRGFRVLVSAWVCGIAMAAAAHAADPAETWRPEFIKPQYTDLISGWYVRGDLGYRWNSIGSVDAPAPDTVTSSSIQNSWVAGFGAGYKYKWFRSDVTVDYGSRAEVLGNTATVAGFYTTEIDAVTLLANVYLDMGTWGGFTPYVGAGAGTTYLRTHEYTAIGVAGTASAGQWSPSWAAMGGVSYQFSPTMLLDVSYRYLKLGDAMTGNEPPAMRSTFRGMSAQEVRIGLRWMLD